VQVGSTGFNVVKDCVVHKLKVIWSAVQLNQSHSVESSAKLKIIHGQFIVQLSGVAKGGPE